MRITAVGERQAASCRAGYSDGNTAPLYCHVAAKRGVTGISDDETVATVPLELEQVAPAGIINKYRWPTTAVGLDSPGLQEHGHAASSGARHTGSTNCLRCRPAIREDKSPSASRKDNIIITCRQVKVVAHGAVLQGITANYTADYQ